MTIKDPNKLGELLKAMLVSPVPGSDRDQTEIDVLTVQHEANVYVAATRYGMTHVEASARCRLAGAALCERIAGMLTAEKLRNHVCDAAVRVKLVDYSAESVLRIEQVVRKMPGQSPEARFIRQESGIPRLVDGWLTLQCRHAAATSVGLAVLKDVEDVE